MKYYLSIIFLMQFSSFASTSYSQFKENKIQYKTYFGQCPSKVAGQLTLDLTAVFEKTKSMKEVKNKIIREDIVQKYFLSSYQINYDPSKKLLKFEFECPKPLMKVQIYNESGDEYYTSILTKDGKLFDPSYELLLRAEKKLKGPLPNLAIPVKFIDKKKHYEITQLIESLPTEFYNRLSEVIVNENDELTMILSLDNRASSVFLGKNFWTKKVSQVLKIYDYMKERKKIPAVINLTNSKKIVVKFPDTI